MCTIKELSNLTERLTDSIADEDTNPNVHRFYIGAFYKCKTAKIPFPSDGIKPHSSRFILEVEMPIFSISIYERYEEMAIFDEWHNVDDLPTPFETIDEVTDYLTKTMDIVGLRKLEINGVSIFCKDKTKSFFKEIKVI